MNTPTKPKTAQGKPELPEMYCQNKALYEACTGEAYPAKAQHSPLPWILQNGAIYDASDNGRVQNVRLCKLVASSTAIEPQDAAYIVKACNAYPAAEKLAEDLRELFAQCAMTHKYWGENSNTLQAAIAITDAKSDLAAWERGKNNERLHL